MLEVQKISVGYGNAKIVNDVSFSLNKGEIIALLGANGAGKTTLLRSLNGALPLNSGEIILEGQNLNVFSRRQIAKRIGVVAQENETKFPLTVFEFVLGGRFVHGNVFGFESSEDVKFSLEALQMCDLKGFENRLMNKLSGGERQRAVLARALAVQAKILLLDEPTANVDLPHQAMIFRLIRQMSDNFGTSAVVITHDLNLASEFADKILLLKNGEVLANGKPEEVLRTEILSGIFAVEVLVDAHPVSKKPRITMSYR